MQLSKRGSEIEFILKANPLKTICTTCGALYPQYGSNAEMDWLYVKHEKGYRLTCRYCKKMYTKHEPSRKEDTPLTGDNYRVGVRGNLRNAASVFADVVGKFHPYISETAFRSNDFYLPSLLYKVISSGKHFVHFLTRSIDSKMLDRLGRANISVRGFISSTEGISNISRLNYYNEGNRFFAAYPYQVVNS